jgi:hypothetical protein
MAINKAVMIGFLACGILIWGASRSSASLVYDDGAPDTSVGGGPIFNFNGAFYSSSNSFTVGGPTNLTGAQVALNLAGGQAVPTLDWSIGTSRFASDIASGTANLTNSFLVVSGDESYWESTFAINGAVSAGTYWLSLANAPLVGGFGAEWTISHPATSTAYAETYIPAVPSDIINPTDPSSFQIYGTTSATPEPTTLSLLGTGVLAVGATRLKRRRKSVAEPL